VKRAVAFSGFFRTLKEIQGYKTEAEKVGHSCHIATKWKMAEMRARRYCRSLVIEHGYQDVHTCKYILIR